MALDMASGAITAKPAPAKTSRRMESIIRTAFVMMGTLDFLESNLHILT